MGHIGHISHKRAAAWSFDLYDKYDLYDSYPGIVFSLNIKTTYYGLTGNCTEKSWIWTFEKG